MKKGGEERREDTICILVERVRPCRGFRGGQHIISTPQLYLNVISRFLITYTMLVPCIGDGVLMNTAIFDTLSLELAV